MRSQRGLMFGVVAIGALLLPPAPADSAARAPHSLRVVQVAARTTLLTLDVHHCDGCSITPVKAGDGSAPALWRGRTKKVRAGVVHWRVGVRRTVGMSFDIVDPNAVPLDSVTDIVVAYRGLAVGARVPAGVAARKKWANGCWAGTTRRSVTLRVRVEHFRGVSDLPPPITGYRIRPYLVRTAAHLRIAGGARYSRTFHGTIGNQDAYFCAK